MNKVTSHSCDLGFDVTKFTSMFSFKLFKREIRSEDKELQTLKSINLN